ncbi:type 2 periplasmic-binding domain-containing protein [Salinibius halmophilus]|uniref:extracellular solute-binding protein n=1 Tax=Salinibius halmophilus TaxID=1853216 RepID=UPI0013148E14|nr:extracellular solute-binding protein [Salinibius halmophilus]
MRESVSDVDGNLQGPDGKVPAGIIKPAVAVSGNEIAGTLIQVIETYTGMDHDGEPEPTYFDTPNLPDDIRQIRNPFFGQFDDGMNGGFETNVSQAVAAYRAAPSFDAGEQCTTLDTLYEYMWSNNYYWDETLQSWEIGALNWLTTYDEASQSLVPKDIDNIAGDDNNWIEQAQAFMPFMHRMDDNGYEAEYVENFIIDSESNEYVNVQGMHVDAHTGFYYSKTESGDVVVEGRAMSADDIAAASPEGETYECGTNATESVCFFSDTPVVADGVTATLADGLGMQETRNDIQWQESPADSGMYLMLEATIAGEKTVFAYIEEDGWTITDGVYSHAEKGISGATVHGPTLADYESGAFIRPDYMMSPYEMYQETGFACADIDFNGCYLDSDNWQFRDANGNGVIELIEISPSLQSMGGSDGNTTLICWQDFRMTGADVDINASVPEAYDRPMPITEITPKAGENDNAENLPTGGSLTNDPEYTEFNLSQLFPESVFRQPDTLTPGSVVWDDTYPQDQDGNLVPFPATFDGTTAFTYTIASALDVSAADVLALFVQGDGELSNEMCEGGVDVKVTDANEAGLGDIAVFGKNDFEDPLKTILPSSVASVNVTMHLTLDCMMQGVDAPAVSVLPVEYELETHTEDPLGGAWFLTYEVQGNGDTCWDERDTLLTRWQPGEPLDESALGMTALLNLSADGEITGTYQSESGATVAVDSNARKVISSPTQIASVEVEGCTTTLSYNRLPTDEQFSLLQQDFDYDGGFIREDDPNTLVIYTYRKQDLDLFQAINEREFLPDLTIEPVLIADSGQYDELSWAILGSPVEADFMLSRTSNWLADRSFFLRSVRLPFDQTVFSRSSLDALRVGGLPYALPHTIQAQGLIWNTGLLTNGTPPATFADFEALLSNTTNVDPMIMATHDWYLAQIIDSVMMAGLVPESTLRSMANNQLCYNNADVLEAWQTVEQWLADGKLVPGSYSQDGMLENEIYYDSLREKFANGEALAMIDGSWSLGPNSPIYVTNPDIQTKVSGLPGGPLVSWSDGGYAPVRGVNAEAQERFLAFMQTPEYAELVANFVGEVPAGQHTGLTIENQNVKDIQQELAASPAAINLGLNTRLNPPYQQGYRQILEWKLGDFVRGYKTAEQLVFEVQQDLQFSGLMRFCAFPAVVDPWMDGDFQDPMDPNDSMDPNDPNYVDPNDPNYVDPNDPNFVDPNDPNYVDPNDPNYMDPNDPNYLDPNEPLKQLL